MPERSRDWIAQARRDLEAAGVNARGGIHEWACFAAHQAAEKALKAVYERNGGSAMGHSLVGLLAGLAERLEIPDDVRGHARLLDRFYIPTRYPNGWDTGSPKDYYTEEDSEDAIGRAGAVVRFCEGLLAG
jgi:HEPN domain-containing protein